MHPKLSNNYMGNTYKLIWSDEALENLKGIIEYLEKNWTTREIKKFARSLYKDFGKVEISDFIELPIDERLKASVRK